MKDDPAVTRGQVWRIPTVGRTRTVLVVENPAVIALHPGGIVCVPVLEVDEARDTLVTIPISQPVHGVVVAPDISMFRPVRFEQGECLGAVDDEAMERVAEALRAVLDL